MNRDELGRFAPGTPPGPGRPSGTTESKPRKRPRKVHLTTGEHLQLTTLDRLDRRTGAGRQITQRFDELVDELDRPLTEIEYGICKQIAYLEFRLSVMQAQELTSGSLNLDPILRAQRELRAWYSFLEARMDERGYRSAKHARRLAVLSSSAGALEAWTDSSAEE